METSQSQSSQREEQSQQAKPRSAGATLGGGAPAGGTQLPLARVKLIIKTDPETSLVSHEAMLLVTKATELFISHLAVCAYEFTVQGKRKTLQRRDIDACLVNHDELSFLEGALDSQQTS